MKLVVSPYQPILDESPARDHTSLILGSRTRYWVYGAAEPTVTVVLVHGFRGDHHGLEAVAAHLVATDPGIQVIAPDLPGFGISEPLREAGHDIGDYALWLRLFVADLGLEGRAVILGHSFGTIVVSAAIAAGMPAPRVVLINPIAAPALSGPNAVGTRLAIFYYWLGSRLPERLGFWVLRWRVVTRGMSVFMTKSRDRGLRRWIHNQHDLYFGAFANRSVVLDAFKASVSNDVSEYAAQISAPVLLIAAAQDEITPVAAQHTLQRLFPDARLTVFDGVGHLIHYERPRETAAAIAEFVAPLGAGEAEAGA